MKDRDLLFGTLAIQRGYASADQVAACIREQANKLASGQVLRLGQVMVRNKLLTANQFMELLEEQEQQILVCPTCNKRYNVRRYEAGKRVRCRGCKTVLTVPTDLDAIIEGELIDLDDPQRTTRPRRTRSKLIQALDDSLSAGDIEGYTIGETLGTGGMGTVYRATPDGELDEVTDVALKIVRAADREQLASFSKRFDREIALLRALDHPAIVAIHDVGSHEGRPWFTMELLEGGSLADRVEAGDPVELLIEALATVAEGLEVAHARRIVHRDIKPANVLFDGHGKPRLTDFGLSRDLDAEALLTQSGQVVGTPHFMAPEQILGDEDSIGPAADVYALGVVLYQILTGELPHDSSSIIELYGQVLEQVPDPPSTRHPQVPPALEAVVMRAVAKDPAERFASAGAFAAAVREATRPSSARKALRRPVSSISNTLAIEQSAAFQAVTRQSKRRHAMIAAAVLLPVFGVGLYAGWLVTTRQRTLASYLAAAEAAMKTGAYAEGLQYLERAQQIEDDPLARTRADHARLALAAIETQRAADRGDAAAGQAALGRFLDRAATGGAAAFVARTKLVATLALRTGTPRPVALHLVERRGLTASAEGVGLGTTPLRVSLPRGRYVLVVGEAPAVVRLPIELHADLDWDLEAELDLEPLADAAFVPEMPRDAGRMTPFAIARREVTVAEYYAWLATLPEAEAARRRPRVDGARWPAHPPPGTARQPVRGVSWHDAMAYCQARGKRLPSVREWQRAYGAEDGRPFPWGRGPRSALAQLTDVGAPGADVSPFGVEGLAGGVAEWVGRPDRAGVAPVLGAAWDEAEVDPLELRRAQAGHADDRRGFRVAWSVLGERVRRDPVKLGGLSRHRYYGVCLAAMAALVEEFPATPYAARAIVDALGQGEPQRTAATSHLRVISADDLAHGLLASLTSGKEPSVRAELRRWARGLGAPGDYLLLMLLVADDEVGPQALGALLDRAGSESRRRIAAALKLAPRGRRRAIERALELQQLKMFRRAKTLYAPDDWIDDRDEVLRLLDRVIALAPELVDGYRLRAEVRAWGTDGNYLGRGADLEGALTDHGAVLDRDPAHAEARLERVRLLLALGRHAEGLTEAAPLMGSRGEDPKLRLLTGRLRYALDQWKAALPDLLLSWKRHPDRGARFLAGVLAARCHVRLGRTKAARAQIADVVKAYPTRHEGRLVQAEILASTGDKDGARALLQALVTTSGVPDEVRRAASERLEALRK